MKRALERYLVYPLSNLVATNQVSLGDLVNVDYDEGDDKLVFSKEESGALINNWENPEEAAIFEKSSVRMPLPSKNRNPRAKSRNLRWRRKEEASPLS